MKFPGMAPSPGRIGKICREPDVDHLLAGGPCTFGNSRLAAAFKSKLTIWSYRRFAEEKFRWSIGTEGMPGKTPTPLAIEREKLGTSRASVATR